MVYQLLEITTPHVTYALLGAFTFFFGMFSLLLREKLYIGEAIWAFVFGIIIGPYGAGIFDPRSWGHSSPNEPINTIIIEFTRTVLTISMFAVGIELPKAYVLKHWKSMFFLLVPVTTWSWFVCAGLIYALIPGPNFLSSLAISACLTPTDPILASAVVGGKWADKHVPRHIRHLLAAESGCNEGAALLFLFFSLYLMVDSPSVGTAMKDWFLIVWLYEIALAIAIGSLLGFSFRHLMKFSQRHDLINRQSYVAQFLSLAMLTVGLTTILGTDDLLAAFVCGTSFSWDGFYNKQTEETVFSSVIDGLFNVAIFIFVGAWMPFGRFHINMSGISGTGVTGLEVWRLAVLAFLIFLTRRLPIMMGLYRWIPDLRTWKEAAMYGHFGPMGITAIFVSTLGNEFLRHHMESSSSPNYQQYRIVRDTIEPIIAFVVLCSIIIHGLSIPGFSLGKRVHSISRTWSRRDTIGGRPDWANRTKLVTRAEDVIINRDLEKGEANGAPLERTVTIMSVRTLSYADAKDDTLKEDTMTEEANFQVPASNTPSRQTAVDQNHHIHQLPPNGERHQSSERRGDQRVPERGSNRLEDDAELTVTNVSLDHLTSTNENDSL